jgi:ribonuclease J
MKLTIHRGTKEIGGTCVEVKTDKTRIVIDFGMPLVDASKKPFDSKTLIGKSTDDLKRLKILPDVKGLYNAEEKSIDAILISHSHMDHYGLLSYVHSGIPVYMSKGAQELIKISSIFTPNKIDKINSHVVNVKKVFNVGDIKITPYLVDHSAFDALAFLIEADGKRIFYSGDFRAHGRKSILFKRIIDNPPKSIDCLLMEGSMLGRENQKYKDEASVQKGIEKILKTADNITFLFVSSQNIDRLVSAYKACLKTNSTFVIDIYTAYILDRLRKVSEHIPQFNWRNVRVKFYKNQADILAEKVSTKLLYYYNTKKIDLFEINKNKNKFLMLARDNSIFPRILKEIEKSEGAKIIYSMWNGYLTDKFREYCAKKGLGIEEVHTSGHATVEDLKAFAKAISPKTLIPIHTFEGKQYPRIFENVRVLKDGELFEV